MTDALVVRFWGVRGSIPTPGKATERFGGNTACVEVRGPGGGRFILDAGSGLRPLGKEIAREPAPLRAHLLLTHFHWDHLQGLPHFEPLRDPRSELVLHAPPVGKTHPDRILRRRLTPTFFPLAPQALGAALTVEQEGEVPWEADGVRVSSLVVNHPGPTLGFRLQAGARSIAYVPDNELGPDPDTGSFRRLAAFVRGVDLLVHGAMFTEREYATRRGWGHSSFEQVLGLARAARPREIRFFHHAPDRGDDALVRRLEILAGDVRFEGLGVRMAAAREGETVRLPERLEVPDVRPPQEGTGGHRRGPVPG